MLPIGQERSKENAALAAEPGCASDCSGTTPWSSSSLQQFQAHTTSAKRWPVLARNCCLLGRDRYWGDSVSELFGFGLEALDLYLSVSKLVEGCSLVHVFHPVAQYAVDQAGQLGGHGLDRDGRPQPGSESTELCSQIGFALPQGAGRHLQGDTDRIVGGQPTFANDLVPADAIVRTQPQPGNEMIFVWPFAHIPAGFANDSHRGHDIDAVDAG